MASETETFWAFNLPLQIWPEDDSDDAEIINYMPRRQMCGRMMLSEALGDGESRADFLEAAAIRLENLARLMRAAKDNPKLVVYYPDEGMQEKVATPQGQGDRP